MEERGSQITTFDGSREHAESIVVQLLGKPPVTLQLQRELVDDAQPLDNTSAGKPIAAALDDHIAKSNREAEELAHQLRYATSTQESHVSKRLQKSRYEAEQEARQSYHRRNRLRSQVGVDTQKIVIAKKSGKRKSSGEEMMAAFLALL